MTRQTVDVPGAKRMIVSLAAATTIGLWAIFARIEKNAAANSPESTAEDGAIPPEEVAPELVINLPPVPTLVPTLAPNSLVSAGGQPVTNQPSPTLGSPIPTPSGSLVWRPPTGSKGGRSDPGPKPSRNKKGNQGGASAGSGSSR